MAARGAHPRVHRGHLEQPRAPTAAQAAAAPQGDRVARSARPARAAWRSSRCRCTSRTAAPRSRSRVGRGRKAHDKRQVLAERDAQREMRNAMGRALKRGAALTEGPATLTTRRPGRVARARPARADRPARALHAEERPGQGLGLLRHRRSADRHDLADRTTGRTRPTASRGCARSGCGRSRRWSTRTARRWRPGSTRWARDFAGDHPDVAADRDLLPRARRRGVRPAGPGRRGAALFKAHVQVGAYDPRDPLLDAVWGQLAEAGVPVVVHCGSGPAPGPFTGPGPFGEVLARHPALTRSSPTSACRSTPSYLDLAARHDARAPGHHDGVHRLHRAAHAVPARRCGPGCSSLADRIVLGSDFPNTPYPYAHQVEALSGSSWATTGCAGCCTTTRGAAARPVSGNVGRAGVALTGLHRTRGG